MGGLPLNAIIKGDCMEVLKRFPDNCIDTIITDPPYGLSFMGLEWDSFGTDLQKFQEWTRSWASEVLRVAKPGATLLVFGGTRTWHRLACGIEDAGWKIRDTLMWVYGQGFTKSLNIGKALGDAYPEWKNYGTALKPAYEPIILAMKPLDGTFVENALKWGVAGLNIDGARIPTNETWVKWEREGGTSFFLRYKQKGRLKKSHPLGRFPANLLLDEASAEILDEQSGKSRSSFGLSEDKDIQRATWTLNREGMTPRGHKDAGGASRFFYVAKASRSERNAGLEGMPEKVGGGLNANVCGDSRNGRVTMKQNNHPTVKPLRLMEYLVRLTLMPNENQIYLDPFLGSGTTAMACKKLGRFFIGIEINQEYVEIAKKRIEAVENGIFQKEVVVLENLDYIAKVKTEGK